MSSDQNQMNQTSTEQEHVQEVEDDESVKEILLNDELADAQTAAKIAEATQQEEQHNLLIEEDFAEQQGKQQQQMAAEEKTHISTLGPKVDAAREKAIALAAAVDNANNAAAEASQAAAAAKELLAAAQAASNGVVMRAEILEGDAHALYNRTAQKIADTQTKVAVTPELTVRVSTRIVVFVGECNR